MLGGPEAGGREVGGGPCAAAEAAGGRPEELAQDTALGEDTEGCQETACHCPGPRGDEWGSPVEAKSQVCVVEGPWVST